MVTLLEINGTWWDIVFSHDDAAQFGAGWYATRDTYMTARYATRRELLQAVRAVR